MKPQRYEIQNTLYGLVEMPIKDNDIGWYKSEDVEKLIIELQVAKELVGDVNEVDGFTEGYFKLKKLNEEMLEVLKMVHSCCSCVRESNVEFCDRCDSDDLIKSIIEKAEGMK